MERSQGALMAAKTEARSARRGIGLVKLMGRSSGFIAMQASMASGADLSLSIGEYVSIGEAIMQCDLRSCYQYWKM